MSCSGRSYRAGRHHIVLAIDDIRPAAVHVEVLVGAELDENRMRPSAACDRRDIGRQLHGVQPIERFRNPRQELRVTREPIEPQQVLDVPRRHFVIEREE